MVSNPTSFYFQDTHFTSSLIVVRGNSGPYRPKDGSPSLAVTGLAVPYGLPKLFMQTMKKRVSSNACPGPPSKGPHQSLTSALPVNAWQITMALSRPGESCPLVVYATGTLYNVIPDSRVNSGITANCCSGIKAAKGFSGCWCVLSCRYSVTVLVRRYRLGLKRGNTDHIWTEWALSCRL